MAKKIALFSPYLGRIGTEAVMLRLADGFVQEGFQVHLLRTYNEWAKIKLKESKIQVIDFGGRFFLPVLPKWLSYKLRVTLISLVILPRFIYYIRREQPNVIIAGLLSAVAVWARELARVSTKIIISTQGWPRHKTLGTLLWRITYPRSDAIVAPSKGVAKKAAQMANVPLKQVYLIDNPVVDEVILKKAEESLGHPWFKEEGLPVILGVGRLTRQKDFGTLLRAFALVRKELPARLMILGEGEDRPKLEGLAEELGIAEDVEFPGFVENPYKFMAGASVFVLSSIWEGPGHVLIEALAVGTPTVSTNCPSGPKETLLDGAAGCLVPMRKPRAMAKAILSLLMNPKQLEFFKKQGLKRAHDFYSDTIVKEYLKLIKELGDK